MSSKLKVHLALLTVAVIYGSNYAIAKLITPHFIQPFGIILIRVFFASIMFYITQKKFVNEKIVLKSDYIKLFVAAVFGVALNQLMFFKGLSITTPVNASLIMTITPILVLITSAILIKEKVNATKIIGISMGFLGAILLIGGRKFTFQSEFIIGDLLIVINALSYGIYLVFAKPLMLKYHPLTVVRWVFFFGFFMVFPFGINDLLIVNWLELEPFVYYCLAFIVLATTFLAYLLNAYSLKHVTPSLVGIYIYLQPIIATTLGVILGQAALSIEIAISSILIFVGVFLVSKTTSTK